MKRLGTFGQTVSALCVGLYQHVTIYCGSHSTVIVALDHGRHVGATPELAAGGCLDQAQLKSGSIMGSGSPTR